MNAEVVGKRDVVQVHITADLPLRSRVLPFADRVEIRFGNAFPVALIVDRDALEQLSKVISNGYTALSRARQQKGQG